MFNSKVTPEKLNLHRKDTLAQNLGIEYTEVGEDYLKARMPVDGRTRQPYGFLHGGASMALAEEVGSMASNLLLDGTNQAGVGLEINANHLKGVREGFVTAVANPVHIGKMTHVWEIKIFNDQNELACISRLTMAIVKKS